MTRIILIRHGQTAWNKVEKVRGQVEIPLDKTGLAQAELTGARVAVEFRPVAVYSSPLQRAVQTAAAIARRLDLQVQPVAGLNDMHFGEWQGLSPAEVEQRWPDLACAWLKAPHTVTFPGGESLERLRQRSMAALHEIIGHHPDQVVAVVAHTVVNRVILMAVLGIDNSNYWRIGQDTCAINVFEWHKGEFYIQSLNDTCHLRSTVEMRDA
jgi:broad specificity phosphatase PhoE